MWLPREGWRSGWIWAQRRQRRFLITTTITTSMALMDTQLRLREPFSLKTQPPVRFSSRCRARYGGNELTSCLGCKAAERQRHSPYPLVPVRDAMGLIFQNTSVNNLQIVNLDESLVGSVLAEDVTAAHDIPEQPTTNVDGYAVRCKALFSFGFPFEPSQVLAADGFFFLP